MVAIGGGFVVLSKLDTGFSEFITGSVVKVRRTERFSACIGLSMEDRGPCRSATLLTRAVRPAKLRSSQEHGGQHSHWAIAAAGLGRLCRL